jgi:hypothetical protein
MYVAPGDFSSDDENELHGSDVGWCTVFKKAYCHRCNSFCFPNLYVRLYWIRDIKDSVLFGEPCIGISLTP